MAIFLKFSGYYFRFVKLHGVVSELTQTTVEW